uniref:Uncharacterized protein n=1 Tax=viral metagenome TaxID=1070528 RepID=A0A6C0KLI7_9ZZZZ
MARITNEIKEIYYRKVIELLETTDLKQITNIYTGIKESFEKFLDRPQIPEPKQGVQTFRNIKTLEYRPYSHLFTGKKYTIQNANSFLKERENLREKIAKQIKTDEEIKQKFAEYDSECNKITDSFLKSCGNGESRIDMFEFMFEFLLLKKIIDSDYHEKLKKLYSDKDIPIETKNSPQNGGKRKSRKHNKSRKPNTSRKHNKSRNIRNKK